MNIINPYIHGGDEVAFDGFGNASRSFDGVSDYVSIPDNVDIPTGAQTWACWAKLDTITGIQTQVSKNKDTGDQRGARIRTNNGQVQIYISQDGLANWTSVFSTSTLSANLWYHLAFTFNPSSHLKVYINGVEEGSNTTSIPANIYDNNADFTIGALSDLQQFHNGNIADVRIYDTDLTSTDITSLYNGTDITTNLIGHWIKDTPSLLDHAGSNDGTNYGSSWSPDNPSPTVEFGDASRSFDGVSDYVDLGNSTEFSFSDGNNDEPFSLSTWVNIRDNSTFRILSKDNGTGSSREWLLATDSGGNLNIYFIDNGQFRGREYTTPLPENEWLHISATYDGSGGVNFRLGLKLYVNGVQVDNVDFGSGGYVAMDASTANNVYIGRYATTYADGKFADVRIYDDELTASEVLDLYNGNNHTDNLIGHWLTNNDDVNDYAGTNDGTNNGSTYSLDNPSDKVEYGGASRSFNGGGNYIDLGNDTSLDITDKIGMSFWVRPDLAHNGAILSKWTAGGGDNNSYIVYLGQDQGNTKITFILQPALGVGGNSHTRCDGSISLSTTEWSHVACIFDGSSMQLYVNGVLDNSVSFTDTIKVTTKKLLIGKLRESDAAYAFDGNIADVRLYDSDLTSTEVYELYKGVDHRTNLIGQWLTNSKDIEDKEGTNDGNDNGSTYSTDSPL